MKSFIKNLFRQSPESEIVEFTQIIRSGERLAICGAENSYINYQLLSRLCSWQQCYQVITIYLPAQQVKFWQEVNLPENFEIKQRADLVEVEKQFIINYADAAEVLDILDKKPSCVISDIDNRYNLLFEPLMESELDLIIKLEDFFPEQKFSSRKLERSVIPSNPVNAFILDVGANVGGKKCLTLIDNLKKDFDPEIYLIGPEFNTAEFVSLKKYPMHNYSEKYSIAQAGAVFITDEAETAQLFFAFGIDLIYIGKEKLEGIRVIDPLTNFEMKSSIPEIIKRG